MSEATPRRLLVAVALIGLVVAGVIVVTSSATASSRASQDKPHGHAGSATPTPPRLLTARRLRPRVGLERRGTVVSSSDLFSERVFANAHDGFALANGDDAQYPALSTDGGRLWRIDGPQVHIDAADGAEAVGYVGAGGPREFFAYGQSVVDVTVDGGRTWWETFLGELVVAVVPGPTDELVAYVQDQVSNDRINPAVTWQYVSRDGGRHWSYSTALGGLAG